MTSRGGGTSSGNNNNTNKKDEGDEDLDTFLTTMENKLRGPFSSLELAKAVTTSALRGSHTPVQYLQNVSKVLKRTEKVIQARVLIGLLGLDGKPDDEDTHREIYNILQQAQQAPTYEEWVRTIAGLIQGIMFETPEAAAEASSLSMAVEGASHRSCRGLEATKLLNQLCEEVCSNVQKAQEKVGDKPCPDLNATFVPYRYSLLPSPLLRALIPECMDVSQNPHFHVNMEAPILQLDEQLEAQRTKEELEHQGAALMNSKKSGSTGVDNDVAAKLALPPGFRPTKLVQTPAQKAVAKAASGASMFMPKKPNVLLAQRQKQQLQQKTMLRRKGAAQSLVNKTKIKNRALLPSGGDGSAVGGTAAEATATGPILVSNASSSSSSGMNATITSIPNTATTTTVAAQGAVANRTIRATPGKFGRTSAGGGAAMAGRSKMKMIDVIEVSNLTKEHAAREAEESMGRMSKKRRILEAAAAAAKKAKTEQASLSSASATIATNTSAAAAAPTVAAPTITTNGQPSSSSELTQPAAAATQSTAQSNSFSSVAAPPPPATTTSKEEEWKVLLRERSNKLSDDDRYRVEQFFQHRFNPTPDQSVVKMKLHEQRSQDPATGQVVKETFYLELDYTNFSSKQSRKLKRY